MPKMMDCKCGKEMFYDYSYQCFECDCGKTYNAVGSELASKSQWADEFDNEDY